MKRFSLLFGIIVFAVLSIFAWNRRETTAITGRVNPVDGANSAWAIGGRDSAASNIVNGNFSFALKPGIYKVVVDGIEPYKDAVLENISVKVQWDRIRQPEYQKSRRGECLADLAYRQSSAKA